MPVAGTEREVWTLLSPSEILGDDVNERLRCTSTKRTSVYVEDLFMHVQHSSLDAERLGRRKTSKGVSGWCSHQQIRLTDDGHVIQEPLVLGLGRGGTRRLRNLRT
jgi:hypothetical protein